MMAIRGRRTPRPVTHSQQNDAPFGDKRGSDAVGTVDPRFKKREIQLGMDSRKTVGVIAEI